ncbi:UDP-glucosyltransferase 2-like [Choristoneura fumiferana]|uniref:UDP-glucosyltransferase 2-like n=1 Tax=Choristoneura fumiferana TaxID=7141 RepID=UPI003D15B6DA
MSQLIYITTLLPILFFYTEAARILAIFPTPSISHQVVFRPLTQELAKRGHDVVVITTDPAFPKGQAPKNLTEIDLHDMSYATWGLFMAKISEEQAYETRSGGELDAFQRIFLNLFERQTQVKEVQDLIKNQNGTFDLILIEAWLRHLLGFSHAIKAPLIQVSSFGAINNNYEVIGAPTHPLVYPFVLNTRLYNLTYWEKLIELYNYYNHMSVYLDLEEYENTVLKRIFGSDVPPLSELQNNVEMLFLNINPVWEGNRPVPPGVIYMGGLHQKPEKELPEDLETYLDSSKNGVIYISFGSNVDPAHFPPVKIQSIINAVADLPYNVLWKWNDDELPGKMENIKISKWFPQSDLLRHPNVKLFITQGGLQSTDEAITAGVPLIGVPIMGDQMYNVEKYVHHKIGLRLNLKDLDETSLKIAIKTVVEDKSYRENIVRLRTLMNDQPMSPLDRAVWWTEHVLRHGGARHLRAPAANMPWTQYYELDLVLLVLSVTLAVIVLSLVVVYSIVNLIKRYLRVNVKVKKA